MLVENLILWDKIAKIRSSVFIGAKISFLYRIIIEFSYVHIKPYLWVFKGNLSLKMMLNVYVTPFMNLLKKASKIYINSKGFDI